MEDYFAFQHIKSNYWCSLPSFTVGPKETALSKMNFPESISSRNYTPLNLKKKKKKKDSATQIMIIFQTTYCWTPLGEFIKDKFSLK